MIHICICDVEMKIGCEENMERRLKSVIKKKKHWWNNQGIHVQKKNTNRIIITQRN